MKPLEITVVPVTLPIVNMPEEVLALNEKLKKEWDREQKSKEIELQKRRDKEEAAREEMKRGIERLFGPKKKVVEDNTLIPEEVLSMEEELEALRKENESLKLKVELLKRLLEEARAEAKEVA